MSFEDLTINPEDELKIIEVYLEGSDDDDLEDIYSELEVPEDAEPSSIEIAVAKIILNEDEDDAPAWTEFLDEPSVEPSKAIRHPEAMDYAYLSHLICSVIWPEKGPAFSGPESYFITYIPGFEKFIVTTMRDSDEVWGTTEHAIGFVDGHIEPTEVAHQLLLDYWTMQEDDYGQRAPEDITDEGLIDKKIALSWAEEVWPDDIEKDEDDEDDYDDDIKEIEFDD